MNERTLETMLTPCAALLSAAHGIVGRRRFTAEEQDAIDAFNEGGYLTHPALDEATKGAIRRGLVLYSVTININPLDPDTQALLGLYEALGLLAPGRAAEIGVA